MRRGGLRRRLVAIAVAALLVLAVSAPALASPGPTPAQLEKEAAAQVDALKDRLLSVSHTIWEYAELSLQEEKSAKLLVDELTKEGFSVDVGGANLPTGFIARYGSGKPVVGIWAEYDALPGLGINGGPGHGCGHNVIGSAALGAGVAVKRVMEKHKLPGTLVVVGSPAEEIGVGKVMQAEAGLYDGIDVGIMVHGGTGTSVSGDPTTAVKSLEFVFKGKTAHAAGAPWEGRDALDAVRLLFAGVDALREHMKPHARVHGIIPFGGEAPNIIPDWASAYFFVRSTVLEHRDYLADRLVKIAEGAAAATGTDMTWNVYTTLPDCRDNEALGRRALQHAQAAGATDVRPVKDPWRIDPEKSSGGASTDFANVTHLMPALTLSVNVAQPGEKVIGHHVSMTKAARGPGGDQAVIFGAKAMAMTVVDLFSDPAFFKKVRDEYAAMAAKEKTWKPGTEHPTFKRISLRATPTAPAPPAAEPKKLTRAQVAWILAVGKGLAPVSPDAPTFTDVPKTHWAFGYIEAAYRAGLVKGTGEGKFQPDEIVAEEHLQLMVQRALALP